MNIEHFLFHFLKIYYYIENTVAFINYLLYNFFGYFMTDIVGIRGYEQVVKQTQNILFDLTSYINYIIYKLYIYGCLH